METAELPVKNTTVRIEGQSGAHLLMRTRWSRLEEATAGVEQGAGASRGRGQQRAETGKPRNRWTDRARGLEPAD